MFDFDIMSFIAGLPGLILAMAVHEYAHARAAVALGDITPRMTGRLTLNPLAHIDPIGLLMLILAHFGWAKPVMINPRNFKNYKRDDILVSLAGPAANLLLAFLTLIVLLIYSKFFGRMSQGTYLVLQLIVLYNINFAIFNMIPLPPLDGSHILKHFLPARYTYRYAQIERYSFFILIVFVMTPVLTYILIPLQQLVWFIFRMILMPFFG
jgi:peptidase, M50 family